MICLMLILFVGILFLLLARQIVFHHLSDYLFFVFLLNFVLFAFCVIFCELLLALIFLKLNILLMHLFHELFLHALLFQTFHEFRLLVSSLVFLLDVVVFSFGGLQLVNEGPQLSLLLCISWFEGSTLEVRIGSKEVAFVVFMMTY